MTLTSSCFDRTKSALQTLLNCVCWPIIWLMLSPFFAGVCAVTFGWIDDTVNRKNVIMFKCSNELFKCTYTYPFLPVAD